MTMKPLEKSPAESLDHLPASSVKLELRCVGHRPEAMALVAGVITSAATITRKARPAPEAEALGGGRRCRCTPLSSHTGRACPGPPKERA